MKQRIPLADLVKETEFKFQLRTELRPHAVTLVLGELTGTGHTTRTQNEIKNSMFSEEDVLSSNQPLPFEMTKKTGRGKRGQRSTVA